MVMVIFRNFQFQRELIFGSLFNSNGPKIALNDEDIMIMMVMRIVLSINDKFINYLFIYIKISYLSALKIHFFQAIFVIFCFFYFEIIVNKELNYSRFRLFGLAILQLL
jgi:hypothetical protein